VRAFLVDFHERTGRAPPLTRAQIGQYLGIAEETVVRAMKAMDRRAV
jgi:CRP-like cAMP-binding protein